MTAVDIVRAVKSTERCHVWVLSEKQKGKLYFVYMKLNESFTVVVCGQLVLGYSGMFYGLQRLFTIV